MPRLTRARTDASRVGGRGAPAKARGAGTASPTPATERATVLAYRLGWSAVRRLPARGAYALFDRIADLMHRRGGKGVERMRSNYARIRPELTPDELDALVHAGLRSYLRYWCESFRLPDRTAEELAAGVRVVGDQAPREALESGQGVVCFLGHLGNWDTVGAWATHHLAPVTTVAERLRPEELFDRFVAYREALGMTILPLTGGDSPFRTLVRTVADGGLVPLLADRDLTDSGVEVSLCGHAARMAGGPAALALATGAPLHPVTVTYEPRPQGEDPRASRGTAYRVVLTFGPAVTVPDGGSRNEHVTAMTQACADFLGAALREHTEDWHMMQRVFVADGIR